jgi:hypothetical protein
LNIYSVRDYLRQWFSRKGIPECPEFPAALSDGWHHPDVMLTILGKEPSTFCVFQTISEKSFCNIMPLANSPGLIWIIKPFRQDFFDLAADFFKDWLQAMYQDAAEQRFIFSAIANQPGELFDRSCCYKISFNGVDAGELRVFSALLDDKLTEPAAVLTIDVGKVLRCMSKETVCFEPDWLDHAKLSRYSAFHAFPGPDYGNNRSAEFLIHEIERICKKSEKSDFARINSLLQLYNSSRGTFSECQKLRGIFRDALRNVKNSLQGTVAGEKVARK